MLQNRQGQPTRKVWGQISRIKNWRSIGGGCFAANFRCQLEGWPHPRRFVVIEEIKNDYAATGIRTNDFWANDALFQTGLIAYNLLNCIRRLALPKGLRTARIKRIGLLLLHMPANVLGRSRRLLIKIERDHPFRLIFYQAMKALAQIEFDRREKQRIVAPNRWETTSFGR